MTTGIRLPQGLLPGLEDIVKFYPQKDADCQLYLPLYDYDLRGAEAIVSKDQNLHVATVTGALWRPDGHYFDGVDDVINCGSGASLDLTTAFTIIVWIKRNGGQANYTGYVGKNSYRYWLGQRNTNILNCWVNNSAGLAGASAIPDVQWLHVAWTHGSSGDALYVDADTSVYGATGDLPDPLSDPTNELKIGLADNNPFKGTVGEVLVYNRALTLAEIQRNYLATKWRYQ